MSENKKDYPGDSPQAAQREKYWKELTVDEKLERMRWVVNTRFKMFSGQLRSIEERLAQLEQHQHNMLGEMVVPLNQPRIMGLADERMDKPRNPDEVFF